jgi:hypothetical protein
MRLELNAGLLKGGAISSWASRIFNSYVRLLLAGCRYSAFYFENSFIASHNFCETTTISASGFREVIMKELALVK